MRMKIGFKPSRMLEEAINNKDHYDVVAALVAYISVDRFFESTDFEDALKYVLDSGITEEWLFEPFNDELHFEEDADKWDEDYYDEARVNLRDNFSKQRLAHVKSIGKKLAPPNYTGESGTKSVEVVVSPKAVQNTAPPMYLIIGGLIIVGMCLVMMLK